MKNLTFAVLACGLAFVAPTRSYASLIAGSSFDASGSFNVGATFLNWNCDQPGDPACATAPANKGDFVVSTGTGTFAQYVGTFGLITDINNATEPLNTPVSLPDFITFDLNANETITLTFLPLGSDPASTDCAGLTHCTPQNAALVTPNNPLGLSAFNLDENATGTSASFGFKGIIVDSSGATEPASGTFTSQFDGVSPAGALADFFAAGSAGLHKTYSTEISIVIPEPATLSLMGAGLLAIGLLGRRLRRS